MFIAGATKTAGVAETAVERLTAYWELTKPRIVTMVVVSAFAGFWAGSAGKPDSARLAGTMLAVILLAAGIFALNQYFERDIDGRMRRTRRRPLPSGKIEASDARRIGWSLAAAGIGCLALFVNGLSAAIGAATLGSYLFIYTPLKTRTPHCTLIGAFPGAAPPLLGWAAATGGLSIYAWVLFAILFLWQFPHFHSIALLYRDDYAQADIRLWPVVEPEGAVVWRQIVGFTLLLMPVSVMPALLGVAGPVYVLGALVLGAGLLFLGLRTAVVRSRCYAQRLLLGSVVYLPCLLGLLVLNP